MDLTQFAAHALGLLEKRQQIGVEGLVLGVDHVAYRVRTGDRERALEEFVRLSNYTYLETHSIDDQRAYTSVLRYKDLRPAIVISEGWDADSVVAQYVAKNGPRIHHVAFEVTDIAELVRIQRSQGVGFTTDHIIGSPEEGLLQIFTNPSPYTGDIIEYTQRYQGFQGFFLQNHVGQLMQSTEEFNRKNG